MTDLRFEEALEASKEYRKQLSRLTTLNNLIETRTLNQYTTQEVESPHSNAGYTTKKYDRDISKFFIFLHRSSFWVVAFYHLNYQFSLLNSSIDVTFHC